MVTTATELVEEQAIARPQFRERGRCGQRDARRFFPQPREAPPTSR
jgi:hypothetical protein